MSLKNFEYLLLKKTGGFNRIVKLNQLRGFKIKDAKWCVIP